LKLEDDLLEWEREKRGHNGRWKAGLYEEEKDIEPHDIECQQEMKQPSLLTLEVQRFVLFQARETDAVFLWDGQKAETSIKTPEPEG